MKKISLGVKAKKAGKDGKDVEVTHHPELQFTGHDGLKMPDGVFEFHGRGRHVAMDKRGHMHPDGPHHVIEVHESSFPGMTEDNEGGARGAAEKVMDALTKKRVTDDQGNGEVQAQDAAHADSEGDEEGEGK